ncbi:hypothetical protein HY487_01160 [Candidatus Woesearchaeota archaeon]|nr:hypothetical protein [Candidatus Woesearchaeota archaeon]
MLKIFNDLESFFRDNYRRIGVREYARIRKISPPSASVLLNWLFKEGLLIKEEERRYIFFAANRENPLFVHLSRIYWYIQLKKSGLLDYLTRELVNPLVILFGSFSKAEVSQNSDIDIAIKAHKKKLDVLQFEKKLGRAIQIIFYDEAKINLQNSILNGFIIGGSW